MLKKILPVVTGAIGFAIGGPMGASIGAGLGSAIRGDNPANIATSALMGYGLGSFSQSAGLFGATPAATKYGATAVPADIRQAKDIASLKKALGGDPTQNLAKMTAREALAKPGLGAQALQFAKDNKLLTGALGLGALQGLGAFKEEEGTKIPPPPEPGSQGMFDVSPGRVTYYDTATGRYGASAPTLQPIARKEGGDIKNFPRKVGQIDGPGTEKSDDIPAMLSDGEFVMTAQAVRGLGALNGADKDDKLEQRRKGAKMMYEMMDKFESKVA
jgi:hypothetical protein